MVELRVISGAARAPKRGVAGIVTLQKGFCDLYEFRPPQRVDPRRQSIRS
jgi:hypothetical protein